MNAALPATFSVANAKLPQTYESAKNALSSCASIDECQDWADKAEALASYAKMADDDTLRKLADRIQARAVRRMGELLKQIEPGHGARDGKREEGPHLPLRSEVARAANISPHQQKQAVRVANIPAEEFEQQVESGAPPTVTKLAKQGTKKRADAPAVPTKRPEGFAAATDLIGTVERFAQFCSSKSPEIIAAAVMPHEIKEVREHVAIIDAWLDRFVVNLKD